jgi:hypothetical protein
MVSRVTGEPRHGGKSWRTERRTPIVHFCADKATIDLHGRGTPLLVVEGADDRITHESVHSQHSRQDSRPM